MGRQARVDVVNNPRTFRVPKGVNVTWHHISGSKEATITAFESTDAQSDTKIDTFKTRAGSTTEIIAKHNVPDPVPDPPLTQPELDAIAEADKRTLAETNYDAILAQARVDGIQTEYDKLP